MSLHKIYKIVKVPVELIKPNPSNPRTISDEKFNQLKDSIWNAPWMLAYRPIVVNKDGIILGGNQRFKACRDLGMTHVWTILADQITDKQQRHFIIRDNIDFGKFDQQIILKNYSIDEFINYGGDRTLLEMKKPDDMDIKKPQSLEDDELEPDISDEEIEQSKKVFNDNTIKQIVFTYDEETYKNILRDLDEISKELNCDDNSEVFLRLINFYETMNEIDNENIHSEQGQESDD